MVIGAVEVVFAVSFAALLFAGYLEFYFLDDGVGLFLGAAALTLAFMAWRAGRRGVVGGLQGTGAAMMAVVSASIVVHAAGSPNDVFLSALAAIMVVMVLCGVVFLWLGSRRRGDLIRFVPYPVVGGFLAGTGWLLFKGGDLRRLGRVVAVLQSPERPVGVIRMAALAPRPRVRRHPARGGPGCEAPARDPGGDRGRARGVRDRDGRHRLLCRRRSARGAGCSDRSTRRCYGRRGPSARSVAPTGSRCSSRGPRSSTAVFVTTIAVLFNISGTELVFAPGPRHEPGAPRRRGLERRLRGARRDPRLSRALPHGAREERCGWTRGPQA